MSEIHAVQVDEWGQPPKYVTVPMPGAPKDDEVQIVVLAVGLHSLVRSLASGKHYVVPPLPHIPGSDGVGYIPKEGNRRVYFSAMAAGGSFRDVLNVRRQDVYFLPDGLDPVQTAALVNPAQSSWQAIKKRTTGLPEDFTALILGATSMSGKVAVPLLRQLGAGKVYGAARGKAALQALDLDKFAVLKSPPRDTDWESVLSDVDVVLDYVYGETLQTLLQAIRPGRRVQVVQIGAVGGGQLTLDAGILRGRDVILSGAGLGTTMGPAETQEEYPRLFEALKNVPKQDIKEHKLSEIETAWTQTKERLAFVP